MEIKAEFHSLSHNSLCNACLCVGRTLYKITDDKHKRYYSDILDEVPLDKPLSTSPLVCWECRALLDKCVSFREQVKDTYKILYTHVESVNNCLLTDVSRPPRLRTYKADSISISSEDQNEEIQYHVPLVLVKDEVKQDWEASKDDDTPTPIDACPISEYSDTAQEFETELQTIITSIDIDRDKKRKSKKKKVKKTKKILKRLKVDDKPKRSKGENQKILTIELTYEDMLVERERESTREAYTNAEFKCETCLIGFHYKKSYQTHMAAKHSPELGDYSCPICNTIISSVESFTAHYKRHMRRYECSICRKRTMDMKVMQQHFYTTHEISLKQYTCNLCGNVANSVDTHRYHMDTHKARVQCPECDKTFRHRAGLMNHRLAVHEFNNIFPCTVCDKVFRWKTSLKRHLEKHDLKGKSSTAAAYCSTCGVSFASICSYQRHLKNSLKHVTHDQLKFICDHCNRRFADKTKLRDHIEEKHLHKTYSCHICNKPSKNRVGLDQHVRNVHRGRPNNKMCHYCGKGFPTKVQLESHIRTHTGERPFVCKFCPTTFSQQSNLYKHNRQVHLNIKSKRYPLCKKRKDDRDPREPSDPSNLAPVDPSLCQADPYRPVPPMAVFPYSPEREFVM